MAWGTQTANERKTWVSLNIQTPASNQAKVYDAADPDRHGKIIKAGPEVSEVRFDDGAERNIPNDHLRSVTVDDDQLSRTTDPDQTVIVLGQAAWHRLKKGSTFEDWKQVGAAHVLGRTAAMREAHVNKPEGRNYNAAFGRWQKQCGFEDLDKAARSRLFEMMDHLAKIEAWRATLTVTQRLDLNHPSAVVRRWKASTVVPDPNAPPRVSAFQKLHESVRTLQEDNDRMRREIERGGGDLWNSNDRPRDIARIFIQQCGSKSKAETAAREVLKLLKAEKQS
jgi:hypothetical protein